MSNLPAIEPVAGFLPENREAFLSKLVDELLTVIALQRGSFRAFRPGVEETALRAVAYSAQNYHAYMTTVGLADELERRGLLPSQPK